jgi:hypothetical protein
VTRKNFSLKSFATIFASPPLFPGPASTSTSLLLSESSVAASSAAAAPARSMSGGATLPAACSMRRMSELR